MNRLAWCSACLLLLSACRARRGPDLPPPTDRDIHRTTAHAADSTKPTAFDIGIDWLEALDLEEDGGLFATRSDEVVVYHAVVDRARRTVVSQEWSVELVFDSAGVTRRGFWTHRAEPPLDDLVFCVLLVELDDAWTRDRARIWATRLDRLAERGTPDDEQLKDVLDTNDALGWWEWPLTALRGAPRTVRIEGSHFMDRFAYRMRVRMSGRDR